MRFPLVGRSMLRYRSLGAIVAVLLAGLCAQAQGAENATLLDKIVATAPTPCSDDAAGLMNSQMRAAMPDQILDGLRSAMQLDQGWKPGNASYDKVRAVVAEAIAKDEEKNGPIFSATAHDIIRKALSAKSDAELRYLANFFTTREGKLYWGFMIDGASCNGWLNAVAHPPYAPLAGVALLRWQQRSAQLETVRERFLPALRALTPDEHADFEKAVKLIGNAIGQAPLTMADEDTARLQARTDKILDPQSARIQAILRESGAVHD